jgi:hypothetical protein
MSYENPQRAIDTQSAQHLANLQKTISGTFQNVAKTYKAEEAARTKKLNEQAEAIDKIKKDNQNIENNLRNNMAKFGAQNPSLNTDAWIGAIDRVNDIKNRIDLGNESAESVAKLRQELAEIMALPTLGKTMLEDITQGVVGLEDSLENAGEMGGADKYGSSTIIKDLMVWQNLLPGDRRQVIQKNETNGKWEASIVINGNTYTSAQLSNLKRGNSSLVATVPNQTENFDSYTAMLKTKNQQTGEMEFNEGVLGKLDTKNDGNGNIVTFRPINKDFVSNAVGIQIDAALNGMSNVDKAIFYNNRIAKKGIDNKLLSSMSPEDFDNPVNQEKFKEGYTNKWFDANIGKEKIISTEVIKEAEEKSYKQTESSIKRGITKSNLIFDINKLIEKGVGSVNRTNLQNLGQSIGVPIGDGEKRKGSEEVSSYQIPGKDRKSLRINVNDDDATIIKSLLMSKGYSSENVDKQLNIIMEENRKSMKGKGPVNNEFYNKNFTSSDATGAYDELYTINK